MNIKKQLKAGTIISILFSTFILTPTSALAERHYSKGKNHEGYSKQQNSNSRSHNNKNTNRHNSHGKKHKGYNRYNSHRPSRYNRHGYSHNAHNGHNQHQYNYAPYYAIPWYINSRVGHNGRFSIGYQDDHFGFTIRD